MIFLFRRGFFLYFIISIFLTFKSYSLEITIPVIINNPLSKTISMPIVGSSNIIINNDDLQRHKSLTIQEVLNLESGIKSRSIYGINSSGSKTTIDVRGMGAQAKSNVLILINGQRLNNIDMSEIDFPIMPIKNIDRIEIIKGSAATVLYGDGVIGGAINIITHPETTKESTSEVILKTGTFNSREIAFNNYQKLNKYFLQTYFNHSETDGYRDENEQKQNNVTSDLRYEGDKGDHLLTLSFNEQVMSTPGDRSQDQLFTDRRGSDTPNDYINSLGTSAMYGMDYKLSDSISFVINSSIRVKDSFSDLQSSSYPSYGDTSLTNYQLTPRINHLSSLFGKISKITYGLDIQYADYESHRKETENAIPLHIYDAWQTNQSIYSQQSTFLTNNTTLGTGLRLQTNRIGIGDNLNTSAPDYAGWQTEHSTLSDQETNYAINLGIDHKINNKINIYGRLSNGFRYPNIDDRIGGSGGTSLELKTQTTKDFEIGSKYVSENFSSNLSTYLIEGKNELAYDTDAFENINMNSTRRYGIELSAKKKISNKIYLTSNLTFSKAKYTSGDQGTYATSFKGNDVPLVPQYAIDTIVDWQFTDITKISSIIKYQDDMRMESDDENFQVTKIPSYVIANLSIDSNINNFFSTLSLNNIFDKKYHNYAVSSSSTLGAYNAYPEPGREVSFSLGVRF
jgi:iron complex outermembrane receptor protein